MHRLAVYFYNDVSLLQSGVPGIATQVGIQLCHRQACRFQLQPHGPAHRDEYIGCPGRYAEQNP